MQQQFSRFDVNFRYLFFSYVCRNRRDFFTHSIVVFLRLIVCDVCVENALLRKQDGENFRLRTKTWGLGAQKLRSNRIHRAFGYLGPSRVKVLHYEYPLI